VFEFKQNYLWSNQITFGSKHGLRVDQVIKFKVKKPCSGQTVQFGCIYEREENPTKIYKQQINFKFDCFFAG
jgi:hypothetical protein